MNSSTKIANERKQEKRAHRSLNLAYIYLKNNELTEAEKHARDYVSHESDDRGHKLLGDILRAQNKRDEALVAYESSLQINPQQEDVLSLVCDLIPPDAANCDRQALWASRAAKSGFLEVADKFRRSQDAAKSSSDSKPNRVLKNSAFTEKTTPKHNNLNDSFANHSQSSLDSVDFNLSGVRTKAQPSPLLQSRPQDGRLRNVPVQSENLMKRSDLQSSKVLESNTMILKAIGENKLLIHSFKKTLEVVVKELRELKLSVKHVEQKQKEGSEMQKKLLDAFQTFQSLNDEEYGDEGEYGEYEDYGDGGYDQSGVPFTQPLSTQTPLNVKTLPNFDHLQISPEKDVEVVFEKKPSSDLVRKAESLQLPSTFFSYMEKDDCPGCRGCEPSDDATGRPAEKTIASSASYVFRGFGGQSTAAPIFTTPAAPPVDPAPHSGVSKSGQPVVLKDVTTPSGFIPPAPASSTPLTFGGNPQPLTEKKSEPFSFRSQAPDSSGSLFSSSKTDGKSGFTFGNSNQSAPWMTTSPAPVFGQKPVPTTNGTKDDNEDDSKNDHDPQYAPIMGMRICGPSTDSTEKPAEKAAASSTSFVFGGFGGQSSAAPNFTAPTASHLGVTKTGQPVGEPANPSGFMPPASTTGMALTFGGNVLSQTENKSEPFSFGFKVPDGCGSFFSSATTDAKSGFAFGNSNQSAPWMTGTPAPVFGQKPVPTSKGRSDDNDGDDDDDDDDGADEYDPQYAPIIEMPNLVEITTGEEDEEVLYSQRAKLFRFDKSTKQWKERGVGDLKILKHRTKPRFRIVMRREQVHKIACNHYLMKTMKLTSMNNSETAVCWFATDYAEEEVSEEQFAAKFKNADLLKEFREKFESLQQELP